MTGSSLEAAFDTLWKWLGGPQLRSEHQFEPSRKWRFDRAHVPTKVAIELEGGVWTQGRHVRGSGFVADCRKYNAAELLGWTVFRLTKEQLDTDPAGELTEIIEFIESRRSRRRERGYSSAAQRRELFAAMHQEREDTDDGGSSC